MTVTQKLFKILSGHVFAVYVTVTLTFDLVTSKFIGVLLTYWRSQLHDYASIYDKGCGPSQVLNIAI